MTDDPLPGGGPSPSPGPGTPAMDFTRYRARRALEHRLRQLDALERALGRRDAAAVWDILEEPAMRRALPAAVRDEAIVIAHLPARIHRAPVNLYRHQHALAQLGDDALALLGTGDDADVAGDCAASPPRTLPFTHTVRGRGGGCRGSGTR